MPATPPSTPIDSLRARISRLAADPRARLLPDAAAIAHEVAAALAMIDVLAGRLDRVERSLIQLARQAPCDET